LLSIGAHKFYGPKGVGVLYIRQGTPIEPIQTGGGQEFNLRAGTHNIPYIVGLAKAYTLAQQSLQIRSQNTIPLRDHLIGTVLEAIPEALLTGHPTQRLPNHASFIFDNVDGNILLMMLDVAGFACSSGSACKTGNPEPSEILLAMGIEPRKALGSLRITLGRSTSSPDVQALLQILPTIVEKNRQLAT
jgi:cysteine desulfurase